MKSDKVHEVIVFLLQFLGTPYAYSNKAPDRLSDDAPFYAIDNRPVNVARVKRLGINCAGLLNLAHRYLGIPIPISREVDFRGGTLAYTETYARPIPKLLPMGSLVMRPPPEGDGHLALVISDNLPLRDSVVIDSDGMRYKGKQPGVSVHKISERDYKYTHWCGPSWAR